MALIDFETVQAKATMSKSMIYKQIRQGKFPTPIKVGERAVRWLEEEVDAWLQARVNARSGVK